MAEMRSQVASDQYTRVDKIVNIGAPKNGL